MDKQTIEITQPDGSVIIYRAAETIPPPLKSLNIDSVRSNPLPLPKDVFTALEIVSNAILFLNEGWEPNWDDATAVKYEIGYDFFNGCFDYQMSYAWKSQPLPPCRTVDIAKKIIEECAPELKKH